MLKVNGKYYPSGKRYSVLLDVDSIYDTDIPITKSSELIISAIHLQLKIPYQDIKHLDITEIHPILKQTEFDQIVKLVNEPSFERHLRNGLNLVGTSNWEDAGNRLGVAFEILIKKILSPSIKISSGETLGRLITLMIRNYDFSKQEKILLWQANDGRKSSSHDSIIVTNRTDYLKLFDAISLIAHKFF